MSVLVDEFVYPFCMLVLNARYLRTAEGERAAFVRGTQAALGRITEGDIDSLLRSGGWREELAAGWFIGLLRLDSYADRLGDLLMQSRRCYAGQGFCFALARIGSRASAEHLVTYLERYLPVGERQYDQWWAVGALAWVDGRLGTEWAPRYVARQDDWNVTVGGRVVGRLDPVGAVADFGKVMAFCGANFDLPTVA